MVKRLSLVASLASAAALFGAGLVVGCAESDAPKVLADVAVAGPSGAPGSQSLRRLTRVQYRRAVSDLFGPAVVVPELGEPDVAQAGLLSIGAADTTYSARGVSGIEDASMAIARQALADPDTRARLVPCAPSAAANPTCSRAALRKIGRSAWRRPLTDVELERVAAVADAAAGTLADFDEGLQFGVSALLQSPRFMYRVELGSPDGDGYAFDDYELASRLSFFLWNAPPDEALLDAAERGELATDEGLRAQAERLLASPRAREGLRNFYEEQLTLYKLDGIAKDPKLFEQFDSELGPDAREETLRLLDEWVFDRDGDIRDIVTTPDTWLNPRLAALYGVPAPSTTGFHAVTLPPEAHRAGLLTQASFLLLQAHQTSTSATRRGKFIRNALLCQVTEPPPVNVDTSIPEPSGTTLTLRDRVKEHLEVDSCSGCHLAFDPLGLGLENYDAIGRYRTLDHGALIDPAGDLDGVPFSDAAGLGRAIREHPGFAPCVVKTFARYALGRLEVPGETAALNTLNARFAAHGYRVRPLLLELVMSPLFRRAGAPR